MKNSLYDGDFGSKTSPLIIIAPVKSTNLQIECLLRMHIQRKSEEWYKQKNKKGVHGETMNKLARRSLTLARL
jgi:cytochrome oxidase assembly protein ShyY1